MAHRPDTEPLASGNGDALSLALRLLAKELRGRLSRHPQGHLLAGGGDSLELRFDLPTHYRSGWLEGVRDKASRALDDGLRDLLMHRALFRPGRVYCLRCRSVDCAHSAPSAPNEVFAGYGSSGLPRFVDLGQWLLERKDSRVDQLYRGPRRLLAHVTPGADLTERLLPAFRDRDSGYRIHGQVAAGWYRVPAPGDVTIPLALTFQLVSSKPRRGQRRFGLNLLGVGPGSGPLEELFDLVGELPWAAPARWAQGILSQVERSAGRRTELPEEILDKRLDGLLAGLARRLERQRRAEGRRTGHGQRRHREKTRPTWKALADLASAKPEDVLVDRRRDTLIVLGGRGRAHVFNRAGKLVTSIRYSSSSIERRRKTGTWRPASPEDIGALRKMVESGEAPAVVGRE